MLHMLCLKPIASPPRVLLIEMGKSVFTTETFIKTVKWIEQEAATHRNAQNNSKTDLWQLCINVYSNGSNTGSYREQQHIQNNIAVI